MAVDISEHGRRDVDREDVVGIGEEAHTGYQAHFYVEPPASPLIEFPAPRLSVHTVGITHENLAESISANAALRFSSRA